MNTVTRLAAACATTLSVAALGADMPLGSSPVGGPYAGAVAGQARLPQDGATIGELLSKADAGMPSGNA